MDDKKQIIITEMRRVAELLKKESLTQREFSQYSELKPGRIENVFGSWKRAIEAADLMPSSPLRNVIPDETLLEEIRRLATELGKRPSEREMNALGRFSARPYRDRWGTFGQAMKIAFSENQDLAPNKEKPNPNSSLKTDTLTISRNATISDARAATPMLARKKVQYGEPIDFRGLRHAPVNEQGVVYMFGMVSRELGFLIEAVRTGYPDCLGKRPSKENPQRWEDVRIEFEFKSTNFDHNPDECDLIVCWIHDWKVCPLEVLELKSAIERLPNK